MKVYFYPITIKRIIDCFKIENQHYYVGIHWNFFKKDTPEYELLQKFIEVASEKAKPIWMPWQFMNLLFLFAADNSIVKVRIPWLYYNVFLKLTKGLMITDIKEKFGTLRIYGNFDKELSDLADETIDLIGPIN